MYFLKPPNKQIWINLKHQLLCKKQEKINIAKRLLDIHMNKEDIIKATGLTPGEIKKLLENK